MKITTFVATACLLAFGSAASAECMWGSSKATTAEATQMTPMPEAATETVAETPMILPQAGTATAEG